MAPTSTPTTSSLSYAAQWDTQHPLHKGRAGAFEYWPGLWGGFLNPPGFVTQPRTVLTRGAADAAPRSSHPAASAGHDQR